MKTAFSPGGRDAEQRPVRPRAPRRPRRSLRSQAATAGLPDIREITEELRKRPLLACCEAPRQQLREIRARSRTLSAGRGDRLLGRDLDQVHRVVVEVDPVADLLAAKVPAFIATPTPTCVPPRATSEVDVSADSGDAYPRRRRVAVSAGVRADDAVCECEHHELGACFELQLAHDVRAMRVDCANGDEKLLSDLLIRVAEGQQVQDVSLSV